MAQSQGEAAKDMVVAFLGRLKESNTSYLQDHSTEIGKAIANLYREILNEVRKT